MLVKVKKPLRLTRINGIGIFASSSFAQGNFGKNNFVTNIKRVFFCVSLFHGWHDSNYCLNIALWKSPLYNFKMGCIWITFFENVNKNVVILMGSICSSFRYFCYWQKNILIGKLIMML